MVEYRSSYEEMVAIVSDEIQCLTGTMELYEEVKDGQAAALGTSHSDYLKTLVT
jgi:hypothetical protein